MPTKEGEILNLKPHTKAFGRAEFSVTLTDDGGSETAGMASAPQHFSIFVSRVNNPPSFELASSHLDVHPTP